MTTQMGPTPTAIPKVHWIGRAADFCRREWKWLIPVAISVVGLFIAGSDLSYQTAAKVEPSDVRLQVIQGVPMTTVTEYSSLCNEQRLRDPSGTNRRNSGGIDPCAELEKMNRKNQRGGGQFRAIFTNSGPEIIENLTAELLLDLGDNIVRRTTIEREAMGLREYERITLFADEGFVRNAALCLTFDQSRLGRRRMEYTLSEQERSPATAFLLGGERQFKLRRSRGFSIATEWLHAGACSIKR